MKAESGGFVCGRRGHCRRRGLFFLARADRAVRASPRADGRGQEGRRQGPCSRRRRSPRPPWSRPTCRSSCRRRAPSSRWPTSPSSRASTARSSRSLSRRAISSSEGSVLFRLDDRWSRRRSRRRRPASPRTRPSLRDAEATLARREALIDKKIVTEAALDQARFAVEGAQGQHRRRPGAARSRRRPSSTTSPSARRSPAAPAASAPRSAPRCAASMPPRAGHDQPDQADRGQRSPCRRASSAPLRRALAAKAHGRASWCPAARSRRSCRAPSASSTTRSTSRPAPIVVKVIAENADEVLWPGLVGRGRAHRRGQGRACCRCRRAPCCRRSRA